MNGQVDVVIFGDEVGIPLVLDVLGDVSMASVVVDPEREAVLNWCQEKENRLYVLQHPKNKERTYLVQEIAQLSPRLGIIASYSRILWPELIEIFPLGVVNLHGGKLPEYRGANVLQWSIINGEPETAITLHYIEDAGVDTGPVIAESLVPIYNEDTALTLRSKLTQEGKDLLRKWLPRLMKKRVEATVQDNSKARIWPRRQPEDGLIDWRWSDVRIRNLTRALVKPWPGAFYFEHSGQKVVLDRALSLEEVQKLRREVLR